MPRECAIIAASISRCMDKMKTIDDPAHCKDDLSPDSVVFDLDGTLWDTCVACARGWNIVLARHKIPFREITVDDIRKVMGKPHEICIRETFDRLEPDQIEILIADTMTEDNRMVEKYGGDLYPGVAPGLQALAKRYRLYIVSNCQSGYIETFLSLTGFGALFGDFECWGNTGKSKGENLAALVQRNGLARPLLVGDMEGDLTAAKFCGIPFVHMTYGFGSVTGCDRAFDSFADLVEFLEARTD
jgi:phosphoglycolate phosphatase